LRTPVAFLIFNRPDTTERVFDKISRARPTKLLVVGDGPREERPGEREKCAAVRAIVERVDWDCEVLTNYSEENLGCRRRISSGLDWVFGLVDEAIILEDDCLPHPSFFRFCEELLARYREDERIMMISGTNYFLDRTRIGESYFFARYYAIWGWASWARAWGRYDPSMEEWGKLREEDILEAFFPRQDMRKHFSRMLDDAYFGRIDTWDIQWVATCLLNNGLSIVPRVNLVSNLGITGTHTSRDQSNNNLPVFDIDPSHIRHPSSVVPYVRYETMLFERILKTGIVKRIRNLVKAKLT